MELSVNQGRIRLARQANALAQPHAVGVTEIKKLLPTPLFRPICFTIGIGCESLIHSGIIPSLLAYIWRSSQAGLHCAHRTSTVSSCVFCAQEGRLAALPSHLSSFISPSREGGLFGLLLRASNEGLPDSLALNVREWPRLPFTARIEHRFIVEALRARRAPGRSFSILLGYLFSAHPRFSAGVAWSDPSPRASREHILIVRTLRAKGTIQATLPSIDCPFRRPL